MDWGWEEKKEWDAPHAPEDWGGDGDGPKHLTGRKELAQRDQYKLHGDQVFVSSWSFHRLQPIPRAEAT